MSFAFASFLFLSAAVTVAQCDTGFDQFFTTNLDTMTDSPITFKKPLPSWLKGSLIRNGIGRFEIGDRHVTTALDAYAKLSKWSFGGDNQTQLARFSTKFVQSKSYKRSVASGDIVPYMMLAKPNPPFSPVETIESLINGADNMNVNIFNYGDDTNEGYVIVSDFWNVYQIDPHNLNTIKPIHPTIPGESTYEKMIVLGSAHPLPEAGTKNHITFASLASAIPEIKSKYLFYRANSAESREQFAEVEVDMISYMHSFAVTENYVILFASPLYVDTVTIFRTFSPIDGFKWEGDKNTSLYVVNLKTGFVKTFETENMFFLHHINAFENEKSELVMDVCTYPNGSALRIMDLKNLYNSTTRSMFRPPTMKRYTLNMETKSVSVNTFDKFPRDMTYASAMDFPTINENFRYKAYCYVYGVVYAVNGSDFLDMALVKKDICTGREDRAWYREGSYFNEAWFVARPGSTDEDDGVLLVDILDTKTKVSSMVIFDAKTLNVTNSAELPTSNPFGTHGRFFPSVQ